MLMNVRLVPTTVTDMPRVQTLLELSNAAVILDG